MTTPSSHGLKTGDYVLHQRSPDWGIGVVKNVRGEQVDLLFERRGDFVFRVHPQRVVEDYLIPLEPSLVPPDCELRDPLLWQKIREEVAAGRAAANASRNLGDMLERFLTIFPNGFADPRFDEQEREYKLAASANLREQLAPEIVRQLIAEGNASEVHRRAAALLSPSKFNLVFRFEYFVFRDVPSVAHEAFARALLRIFDATSPAEMASAVENLGLVLTPHNAGKWTICTTFPFLWQPSNWPFVKPAAVSTASQVLDYSLEYQSRPNAKTYLRIHTLYDLVAQQLRSLKHAPRDMIDIQTFLWIGSGLGYQTASSESETEEKK